MTFGLLAGGPLQMLFSLLLMQGLSLTMWRTFLNQAIPRFDPLRFSVNIGNRDEMLRTSTTTPAPPLLDPKLLPYLNLLSPLVAQQQQQQQMSHQMMTPQMMAPQTHQQMVPSVAPAVQPLQPLQPQVIVVPQLVSQPQQVRQGSASTHIPVQVEPPERPEIPEMPVLKIYKRMLERPPKTTTTSRPKVVSRLHAGALHVSFVTPKIPAGFRRYIISPVTAKIDTDLGLVETTTTSERMSGEGFQFNLLNGGGTRNNTVAEPAGNYSVEPHLVSASTEYSASPIATNYSKNNLIVLDESIFTTTTNPINIDVTDVAEPILDSNELNKTENTLNETLIHEEFKGFVKNLTELNPIDSNQSPTMDESKNEIFFENSKGLAENKPKNHVFKRVCYYLLDARDGDLKVSEIDPFICTHLIVGFARVAQNDLLVPRNPSEDPEKYRQLTNLKALNRKLKVMLSVGDIGGAIFSKMVASNKSRDNFVASALDICDTFDFDGIEIDWEFPSFKTGSKDDKKNFISLLKELRQEAFRRFRDDFLISAAVGTPLVIAMTSYDIPLLAEAVDFVNLMTYDFHYYRADRPYTGHHSPLYPRPIEKGYFLTLNAAWSATYWANKGMPLNKIVLGVPFYARSYNLVVPIAQGMDVPVSGPGLAGGKLNYTSVCRFLSSGATKEFEIHSQVPFAYKDYDWIAYENELSVSLKAEWVVRARMAGIHSFALNYDDVTGSCRSDGKKFPLQKAISNLLELASIRAYQKSNHLTS